MRYGSGVCPKNGISNIHNDVRWIEYGPAAIVADADPVGSSLELRDENHAGRGEKQRGPEVLRYAHMLLSFDA